METIHVSGDAKYQDILSILGEKLRRHGEVDERMLDALIFLCEGRVLQRIRDKALNSYCEVFVGYADFGG